MTHAERPNVSEREPQPTTLVNLLESVQSLRAYSRGEQKAPVSIHGFSHTATMELAKSQTAQKIAAWARHFNGSVSYIEAAIEAGIDIDETNSYVDVLSTILSSLNDLLEKESLKTISE